MPITLFWPILHNRVTALIWAPFSLGAVVLVTFLFVPRPIDMLGLFGESALCCAAWGGRAQWIMHQSQCRLAATRVWICAHTWLLEGSYRTWALKFRQDTALCWSKVRCLHGFKINSFKRLFMSNCRPCQTQMRNILSTFYTHVSLSFLFALVLHCFFAHVDTSVLWILYSDFSL